MNRLALPDDPGLQAQGLRLLPCLRPFSTLAIEFLAAFSEALRAAPGVRRFPELAALAFWMRKSHVEALRRQFEASAGTSLFQPRGTVFHIAPGNVDSIFIYSWFLSLLCGNRNIVRLPSRRTPQLDLLCRVLQTLLEEARWQDIAARVTLVRYPREDRACTERLSSLCDLRVVWGGDATITEVRRIALPPRAAELCFANRFSMALVHAGGWLQASSEVRVQWLARFHADAWTFGQMACSSPRLVAWHGQPEVVQAARAQFWQGLDALASERSADLMAIDYVNKALAGDLIALRWPVSIPRSPHNAVARVDVAAGDLKALIDADLHCGAGLFYETCIEDLGQLGLFVDERMQTLVHAGYDSGEPIRDCLLQHSLAGITRVLPFGRALDFSAVWDGHDLLRAFTRQITIV